MLTGAAVTEIFDDQYADLYDVLYAGKNYEAEVRFLLDVHAAQSESAHTRSVLDLGCGTGRHLEQFSKDALKHGVDQSRAMISTAERRRFSNASFTHSVIQNVDLDQQFDLVFSLFHVLSYQTTMESALGMFRTVERHLAVAGIGIVDFWHRPAWDSDPPTSRVTQLANDRISVFRVSEPSLNYATGVVDLDITMFLNSPNESTYRRISEQHQMRAFTMFEIELLAKLSGLRIVNSGPWMHADRAIGEHDWYGWAALKRAVSSE